MLHPLFLCQRSQCLGGQRPLTTLVHSKSQCKKCSINSYQTPAVTTLNLYCIMQILPHKHSLNCISSHLLRPIDNTPCSRTQAPNDPNSFFFSTLPRCWARTTSGYMAGAERCCSKGWCGRRGETQANNQAFYIIIDQDNIYVKKLLNSY